MTEKNKIRRLLQEAIDADCSNDSLDRIGRALTRKEFPPGDDTAWAMRSILRAKHAGLAGEAYTACRDLLNDHLIKNLGESLEGIIPEPEDGRMFRGAGHPIFLGNGNHSLYLCAYLHRALDEAFSDLGGIQQSPFNNFHPQTVQASQRIHDAAADIWAALHGVDIGIRDPAYDIEEENE